jgi:hypothetical protein
MVFDICEQVALAFSRTLPSHLTPHASSIAPQAPHLGVLSLFFPVPSAVWLLLRARGSVASLHLLVEGKLQTGQRKPPNGIKSVSICILVYHHGCVLWLRMWPHFFPRQ